MRPASRAALVVAATAALGGCAVSRRDEARMGADYAAQLDRELPMIRDAELTRYLAVLGDSLALAAGARDLPWSYRLVRSAEVNAFALPGGHVYVTRGLVERTTTMSQLAGVLGHEIAHVTRRHAVRQMQRMQTANVGVTLACVLTRVCASEAVRVGVDVGGAAVFARYGRDDEAEADLDAVRTAVRAGVHPRGIMEMFEKLLAERAVRPQGLAAWFATHPTEEARIARTARAIAELDIATLARLTVDTPAFQRFHARLLGLPAVGRRADGAS